MAHRRKEPLHLRTIIVHYHIFKNAGSSVDRLLNMAFGDGRGTWKPYSNFPFYARMTFRHL